MRINGGDPRQRVVLVSGQSYRGERLNAVSGQVFRADRVPVCTSCLKWVVYKKLGRCDLWGSEGERSIRNVE